MRTRARAWQAVVVVGSAAVACAVLVGVSGGIGGTTAAPALPAPVADQVPAAGEAPSDIPADAAGAFRLDPAAGVEPGPEPTKAPVTPAAVAAPKKARPTPAPAPKPVKVKGTPCTSAARACVDLDDREAWLIDDGKVVRGPVEITHGDDEDPTPTGTFHVQWKAEEYTSREYLTQMPYSVFFADGGVAFHEGNQETPSAGCVKLEEADAKAFFAFLQVGDEVQVH